MENALIKIFKFICYCLCLTSLQINLWSLLILIGEIFFVFFWHATHRMFIPRPRIKPIPPSVKVWSPNHRTTRGFPGSVLTGSKWASKCVYPRKLAMSIVIILVASSSLLCVTYLHWPTKIFEKLCCFLIASDGDFKTSFLRLFFLLRVVSF